MARTPRIEGRRGAMEARGDVDDARQMGQLEAVWSAMGSRRGRLRRHILREKYLKNTRPRPQHQRGQTPGGPCPPRQAVDLPCGHRLLSSTKNRTSSKKKSTIFANAIIALSAPIIDIRTFRTGSTSKNFTSLGIGSIDKRGCKAGREEQDETVFGYGLLRLVRISVNDRSESRKRVSRP